MSSLASSPLFGSMGWKFYSFGTELALANDSAYSPELLIHLISDLINCKGTTGISPVNFSPAQINKKRAQIMTQTSFPPLEFCMKAQHKVELKHLISTSVSTDDA